MANDTVITIVGNLTDDPTLRFTSSGAAVATFTVASTPRSFDKASGEWKDQESLFMRCSIWRQPAENAAESLRRGQRVVVVGRLKQRSFEVDGQKRSVVELEADEIGASLRYAKATVEKVQRSDGGGQQASRPASRPQRSSAPSADPWGDVPPPEEEPPF